MVSPLLTIKEMAVALRVSATTAYQLVEQGKVPCHRVGVGRGAIRIKEEDLVAYLERCRSGESPVREQRKPVRTSALQHLSIPTSNPQNHSQ